MSTLCGLSSFSTDSMDLAGVTYDIVFTDGGSGVTFQPTCVFFFWGGLPFSTFLTRSNINYGRGFCTSVTNRGYAAGASVDAVGTTVARRAGNTDGVVVQLDTSLVATQGRLDINAFNVDGIQLIVDEKFVITGMRYVMLGVAGDLADANIQQFLTADDACFTTPRDVTGFSFDPVCGISLGHGMDAFGIASSESRTNMGMFRSAAQQGVWAGSSEGGGGTTSTAAMSRFADIAIARMNDSGSVANREDFNALITDGFRFNCLEDNNDLYQILGMLGGSFHIEEFLTRTSVGTIILTPGFEVSGGIIMSCTNVEAIDNDHDSDPKKFGQSLGAFSGVGAGEQRCMYGHDVTGLATSQVTNGNRSGSVYMRGDEAASPALAESIEVTTIGATTVTLTQSVAAAVAEHCIAVLFGTRAAVAAGGGEHKEFNGIRSHAYWIRKKH